MITINNLVKRFGEKVAVNIDHYTIQSGDMLGLVGNNGAGKTTLFRLALDLLKADEGNVMIDDIDATRQRLLRAQSAQERIGISIVMAHGF